MMTMARMSLVLFLLLAVISMTSEARRRRPGGVCGLTCYRWKKCKGVLATLTDTTGDTRYRAVQILHQQNPNTPVSENYHWEPFPHLY